MNFSSSLMSGMGISLGGLELANDYLFANPDFYEPELTEIKTIVSKKPSKVVNVVRPIKPKVTKDNIIAKFSIIHNKANVESDEVLDSGMLVQASDDFDFSFDDMGDSSNNTIQVLVDSIDDVSNNTQQTSEEIDNALNNDILAANLLSQQLAGLDLSGGLEDTDEEEDEEGFTLDELDEDENESSTEEESDDFDIEIEDEDETEEESLEDEIDNLEFEDDEESENEEPVQVAKPVQNVQSTSVDEIEFNLDEDDTSEEDEIDIEIEEEEPGDTDDDEDMFDLDDDEEVEVQETKVDKPQDISQQALKQNENQHTIIKEHIKVIEKTIDNKETEQLRKQVADMERKIHEIEEHTSKNASDINGNVLKNESKDSVDDLIARAARKHTREAQESKYDRYSNMQIDSLYKLVREYMVLKSVNKRAVDISVLNNEFGELNIRKLIQKSYLIKINKGVTTGR